MLHGSFVHAWVFHDAAATDVGAADLELRFDQDDQVPVGPEQLGEPVDEVPDGDEGHIDRNDVELSMFRRPGFRRYGGDMRALKDDHALVAAQTPVELAVSHVEGHDRYRPAP